MSDLTYSTEKGLLPPWKRWHQIYRGCASSSTG